MLEARSENEARLYVEIQGCLLFRRLEQGDELVFECVDAATAAPRIFRFRKPPSFGGFGFGGQAASTLIGPGEFFAYAEKLAQRTPRSGAGLVRPLLERCLADVAVGIACLEEIGKFSIEAGSAIWSDPAQVARRIDLLRAKALDYQQQRPFALAVEGVPEDQVPGTGFSLRAIDVQRLGLALRPGAPFAEALADAVGPPDVAEHLVAVASAEETVRFLGLTLRRAQEHQALLLVMTDPRDRITGHRVVEGQVGYAQLRVLREVAPHLPPASLQRPPAELARQIQQATTIIAESLQPLLHPFAQDDVVPPSIEVFRPREGDVEAVFQGPHLDEIRARYERIWERPGAIRPEPGETNLLIAVCTGGGFQSLNAHSAHFPLGYLTVSRWLRPERTWVTWMYCQPDVRGGTRYDGLVWVGDHWAWFPGPHRVLADLPTS